MIDSWKFLKWWKQEYKKTAFKAVVNGTFLPRCEDWFKALELTPFDKVKVVLLGQDPYPSRGHAHGLSFSVQPHVKPLPASLRNIFKEYQADLQYPEPRNGDLRTWAERGVLLLNTILTVEEGKSLSHQGIGWERLAYEIVRSLSDRGNCVMVCMGRKAEEYRAAFLGPAVVVPHPSPLATGFLGSRVFSKTNEALKSIGVEPIDWRLP